MKTKLLGHRNQELWGRFYTCANCKEDNIWSEVGCEECEERGRSDELCSHHYRFLYCPDCGLEIDWAIDTMTEKTPTI